MINKVIQAVLSWAKCTYCGAVYETDRDARECLDSHYRR